MGKPQSILTSALVTISEQQDSSRIEELVREGVTNLAECIRKDGAPYPLTSQLVSVWVDVFQRANAAPGQLEAAFHKAERACKFWPSPADVLGFMTAAGSNAAEEEAAEKFERVLAYAIRRSPDIPDRNAPRISERTRRATNAAGGLDYLRDCDRESLQWARKRFIERYVRWGELQEEQYLLPPGGVRDLLAEFAGTNSTSRILEAPKIERPPVPKPQTRADVASAAPIREIPRVVDVAGRTAELERQKKLILEKYPSGKEVRP